MGVIRVQGLANRRVGATAMNSESSRSHSVFTCVIESRSKVPDLFSRSGVLSDYEEVRRVCPLLTGLLTCRVRARASAASEAVD